MINSRRFRNFFTTTVTLVPLLFSILFFASYQCTDSFWAASNLIATLKKDSRCCDFIGRIVEPFDYPTYYNANYFYKLQAVSYYWGFEEDITNCLFLHYHELDGVSPAVVSNGEKTVGVDIISPLSGESTERLGLSLAYGEVFGKETLSSCCEMVYISKPLAAFLGIDESSISGAFASFDFRKFGPSPATKTALSQIKGVIVEDLPSPYKDMLQNPFFAVTNWSTDLQTTMCSPSFNVLFGSDTVKNKVYLQSISNALLGRTAKLQFFDKPTSRDPGVADERIYQVLKQADAKGKDAPVVAGVCLVSLFFFAINLAFVLKARGKDQVFRAFIETGKLISFLVVFFTCLFLSLRVMLFESLLFVCMTEFYAVFALLLLLGIWLFLERAKRRKRVLRESLYYYFKL